jgi:hypothetical protein
VIHRDTNHLPCHFIQLFEVQSELTHSCDNICPQRQIGVLFLIYRGHDLGQPQPYRVVEEEVEAETHEFYHGEHFQPTAALALIDAESQAKKGFCCEKLQIGSEKEMQFKTNEISYEVHRK